MNNRNLFVAIVNKEKAEDVMRVLRECGVDGGTITYAEGTASSTFLSLLGFGSTEKEVLFSYIENDIEKICLEKIKEMKIKGVIAIVDNKGDDMNKWVMIEVITEFGLAEDVMAEARKAGAKGGTIIKGRGTAKEGDVSFFGYPITEEKELLIIIEKKEKEKQIVDAIEKLPFLKEKGRAVIFTLPVTDFRVIE